MIEKTIGWKERQIKIVNKNLKGIGPRNTNSEILSAIWNKEYRSPKGSILLNKNPFTFKRKTDLVSGNVQFFFLRLLSDITPFKKICHNFIQAVICPSTPFPSLVVLILSLFYEKNCSSPMLPTCLFVKLCTTTCLQRKLRARRSFFTR